MSTRSTDDDPKRPPRGRPGSLVATVYGGGVTGLTAAHELAVRGFRVHVVEPAEDVLDERGRRCAVGGMAKTQWTALERPVRQGPPPAEPMQPTRPYAHLPGQLTIPAEDLVKGDAKAAANRLTDELESGDVKSDVGRRNKAVFAAWLVELAELHRKLPNPKPHRPPLFIYVEGRGPVPDAEAAGVLAEIFAKYLRGKLHEDTRIKLEPLGTAEVEHPARDPQVKPAYSIVLRARQYPIPGEHGYRFFPSFYAHLFDTMRRTPLLESSRRPDEDYRALIERVRRMKLDPEPSPEALESRFGRDHQETFRTAFDNLVALPRHAVAAKDFADRPVSLPRQRPACVRDVITAIRFWLEGLHFTMRDALLLEWKILQFATSCDERREAEYGNQSWADFVESHRLSPALREELERWPDALVAMSATECDARTQGEILLQLLIDQTRVSFTDGTLDAPTSVAWLEPWRDYLEHIHEVTFHRGKLLGFHVKKDGDELLIYPNHEIQDEAPEGQASKEYWPGYYVVCLPVQAIQTKDEFFFEDLLKAAGDISRYSRERKDLTKLKSFVPTVAQRSKKKEKTSRPGRLQDFCGVQLYFGDEINWVNGHTYFPGSKWGLSAIAQTAFRAKHPSFRLGYRGILSVDLGVMDEPGMTDGPSKGKTAWGCTHEELAREVWAQIKAAVGPKLELPEPLHYHVDEGLDLPGENGLPEDKYQNATPFLIPLVGDWTKRLGSPGHYEVYFDCLALAGTYMQTYTRLTTMEAANESARHAVNAIVRHARAEGSGLQAPGAHLGALATTWPLSERELEELDDLKDIDRRLFEAGRPHLMAGADVHSLVSGLPTSGSRDGEPQGKGESIVLRECLRLFGR